MQQNRAETGRHCNAADAQTDQNPPAERVRFDRMILPRKELVVEVGDGVVIAKLSEAKLSGNALFQQLRSGRLSREGKLLGVRRTAAPLPSRRKGPWQMFSICSSDNRSNSPKTNNGGAE